MKKKVDIDEQVAVDLGMKKATVALVTAAFLNSTMHALVEDGEVRLESFGRFRLHVEERIVTTNLRKGTGKKGETRGGHVSTTSHLFRVWFRKAAAFKDALWAIHGKSTKDTKNQ